MTTRDLSKFHEMNVAKALGGHRTPNSGATPFTKGDVVLDDFIVECKTKMTEATSFGIKKEWLDTLEEERRGMGKDFSALAFSFNSGKDSYYIVNERTFKQLVECKHIVDRM